MSLDEKCSETYGFDLKETYKLTLKFYKGKLCPMFSKSVSFQIISFFTENEGKSVQLQYDDRLHLIALTQQANHGKLVAENLPPLGALDVIGKDRRQDPLQFGFFRQFTKMLIFF